MGTSTALLLGILLSTAILGQALTPSSFITAGDKERFKQLFAAGLQSPDLTSLAYSIMGFALLGEVFTNPEQLCRALQSAVDVKPISLYQATSAAKLLTGCKVKLPAEADKVIADALASDESVANLFYAAVAKINVDAEAKLNEAATMNTLLAALKKDDSLSNLGFAFHLASHLTSPTGAEAIFDRIEDAVVQADEVDGKMLQFEGGLSVSSWIISGAYKLAEKVKKAPTISMMQAVKFANYFLSRKSVYQPKGCFSLLHVITVLTTNKFHTPVSISVNQPAVVSQTSPTVRIKVTNLLGQSLGPMNVIVESAKRQSDSLDVLSKSKANAVSGGDDTLYDIDMWAAKPGRGFYKLIVTATPTGGKAGTPLAGNEGAVLLVKALSSVELSSVELGVADADQSSSAKFTALNYPTKLPKVLEADHHHKVILKFVLKDKSGGDKIKVNQAFVRLENEASGAEIIFVAEPDANSLYKFDLDVHGKSKLFGSKSGVYKVHLIIGDAVIDNPISWYLADMNLKFATVDVDSSDSSAASANSQSDSGLLPEIRHKFREPEKRPAAIVSNTFTVLCMLPILIMVLGWVKLGINVSNFSLSLPSLGFHLSLGGIFLLYYFFWLRLDMFVTVKYLVLIGVLTFLTGHAMLVKLADQRKQPS